MDKTDIRKIPALVTAQRFYVKGLRKMAANE
jgi:hypothetical protein